MFGFGGTSTQSQSTSFNFGSFNTQPANNTIQFGSTNTQSSTTPSFAFGASTSTSAPSFQFGSTNTQPANTGGFSGFGSSTAQPPFTGFHGQQPTQQQIQPSFTGFNQQQQQQPQPTITLNSRFSELPSQYQSMLSELESHIKQQNTLCYDITQHIQSNPKINQLSSNKQLIHELHTTLNELNINITRSTQQCDELNQSVDNEIRQCELSIRTVAKLTQSDTIQSNTTNPTLLNDSIYLPSQYHWNKLIEFNEQLNIIKQLCIDIENNIQFAQSTQSNSINDLYNILSSQQHILTQLIGKIAVIDDYYHQIIVRAKSVYGQQINNLFNTNNRSDTLDTQYYKPVDSDADNNKSTTQLLLTGAATKSIIQQHQDIHHNQQQSPPPFTFRPLGSTNDAVTSRKKRGQ